MKTLVALCFLLLGGCATPAASDTLHGVVFVVIDGDTVLFKPDHFRQSRAFLKIRLAAIDAPEKHQPYGSAATDALKALVLNQRVAVDTVATDVHGRTLAHLRRGRLMVNLELVRQGLAWSYSGGRAQGDLAEAQREARRAQRGLWQDAEPTPPWVWRRAQAASAP